MPSARKAGLSFASASGDVSRRVALVRSLGHPNTTVRSNAAQALAKVGASAVSARAALERAARDEDGSVRSQAVRAVAVLAADRRSG